MNSLLVRVKCSVEMRHNKKESGNAMTTSPFICLFMHSFSMESVQVSLTFGRKRAPFVNNVFLVVSLAPIVGERTLVDGCKWDRVLQHRADKRRIG
ncbi:hypothetical protein CEXT_537291 [Caerostris extrusa]|uniref:Uncharacterized protein n=1 Tax=Caerostris extrusa TaxID=172846 RepID=A0AAV4S060_CAEEX|nr:hypothetical protein CEXT_537291 [Caerostris extrusa]